MIIKTSSFSSAIFLACTCRLQLLHQHFQDFDFSVCSHFRALSQLFTSDFQHKCACVKRTLRLPRAEQILHDKHVRSQGLHLHHSVILSQSNI